MVDFAHLCKFTQGDLFSLCFCPLRYGTHMGWSRHCLNWFTLSKKKPNNLFWFSQPPSQVCQNNMQTKNGEPPLCINHKRELWIEFTIQSRDAGHTQFHKPLWEMVFWLRLTIRTSKCHDFKHTFAASLVLKQTYIGFSFFRIFVNERQTRLKNIIQCNFVPFIAATA